MEDLIVPFIFVPDGNPEPTGWLAEHPNAIKVHAKLVPRPDDAASRGAGLQFDFAEALERFAPEYGDPNSVAEPLQQGANSASSTTQSKNTLFGNSASTQSDPESAVKAYLAAQVALGQLALDPAPLGPNILKGQHSGNADVAPTPNVTRVSAPAQADTMKPASGKNEQTISAEAGLHSSNAAPTLPKLMLVVTRPDVPRTSS